MTNSHFAEHYDEYYGGNDEEFSKFRASGAREKFENIADLWGRIGQPRPSVVDIGCGDGAIANCMADADFYSTLAGYDVSSSGIRQASARGLTDTTFELYSGKVPVPDKHFDLAVLSHVVEHVEEPRLVLREAARVARWVVVEVPLEHTLRHGGDFKWTDTGHVNFYDLTLIRKLMQSCNLDVKHELVTTPGWGWVKSTGDRKGQIKWAIRRSALAAVPPLARLTLSYHATLIASA